MVGLVHDACPDVIGLVHHAGCNTADLLCSLVHNACGDAVGDVEGVDLFEPEVQLAVEGLAHAPAEKRKTKQRRRLLVESFYISPPNFSLTKSPASKPAPGRTS